MTEQTQAPPPDPRMAAIQSKAQAEQIKAQIDQARVMRARLMREILVDALGSQGGAIILHWVILQPSDGRPHQPSVQSNRLLLRHAKLVQPPRGAHPDLDREPHACCQREDCDLVMPRSERVGTTGVAGGDPRRF
ncbi:hypothetical protein SAMN05443247_07635 [Bradyrhizobium erythrophlei]|jgi:hypothetical protein|nr:hypothetical protein SAMN05443247_07635 [Bradyrhizobium erythrophlei]